MRNFTIQVPTIDIEELFNEYTETLDTYNEYREYIEMPEINIRCMHFGNCARKICNIYCIVYKPNNDLE